MSIRTLLDLRQTEVGQRFNQSWLDIAIERIGQLVVVASTEDRNHGELVWTIVSVNLCDFSGGRSGLLEEFDGLRNETVNANVRVKPFALLSIARRRTHLNTCTVQVHVVVVNIPVWFASAYCVDATVLTHEVLTSSHRSSNKGSVVVELVNVVELGTDLRRKLLVHSGFGGRLVLLNHLLVVVHVRSELFLEFFSDLTLLVRCFL